VKPEIFGSKVARLVAMFSNILAQFMM